MPAVFRPFRRVSLWRIERQLRREDPTFAEIFKRWSASESQPPAIGCPAAWRQSRWRLPFSMLAASACLIGLGAAFTVTGLLLAGLFAAVAAAAVLRIAADRPVVPLEPAPRRPGDHPPPRPAAPPRGVMG